MAPRLQDCRFTMRPTWRAALAALTVLLAAAPLGAAIRLTYTMQGAPTPVFWPRAAFPIPYEVDRRIVDAGAAAGIERAFNIWTTIGDADVSFRDGGAVAGLKAGADGHNTVTIADKLFADQGFIAVTTNWYRNDGTMNEADIQIDPCLLKGDYNLQQTVAHEVGHLLGLDHSGVVSSIMYPYVSKSGSMSLESDDKLAIATLYSKNDPALAGGTLKGRVVGNDGAIFAAQVVAVNEKGEPVATSLTNETGDFVLNGLPQGSYRVYAEPLDGPVEPRNLAGVWRTATSTTFRTSFTTGVPLSVSSGKVYGNLVVDTAGAPSQLNPKWIGASLADQNSFSLSATPVALRAGQTMSIAVGGDGFVSGMTTFDVLNPGVQRVSDYRYAGNYVYATFRAAPDAALGSAVILVKSGNDTATLTGALRVEGGQRLRVAAR
jgi:hypothetical protein